MDLFGTISTGNPVCTSETIYEAERGSQCGKGNDANEGSLTPFASQCDAELRDNASINPVINSGSCCPKSMN